MVNKGSHFADFVRFRPHTYTRSQQSQLPLWVAIISSLRIMLILLAVLLYHGQLVLLLSYTQVVYIP